MGLEVKEQTDLENFGDEQNSFTVSMCYFAVVPGDHQTIKYLKSTGFASCVGLILHSEALTLLAHFQSANWATKKSGQKEKNGITGTIEAFGKARILDWTQYEGFLFFGNKKGETIQAEPSKKLRRTSGQFKASAKDYEPSILVETNTLQSVENSQNGLERIRQKLRELGAKVEIEPPTVGFTSVAVSIATGEIRLFHDKPKAPFRVSYSFVQDGDALKQHLV